MRIISATCAAFLLIVCASASAKDKNPIVFGEKPSEDAAEAKMWHYLKSYLIDPYSAQVECTDVSEKAWIKPSPIDGKRYGYFVICNVNAKNKFGGYTGAKRFIFRYNGNEFQHEDMVWKMGLYEN